MSANVPMLPPTDVRLEVGAELSATVLMASGFVLADGVQLRERYRIEGTLGKGGMGQVFAVSIVGGPESQLYALKVVARPEDHNRDGIIDDEERAAAQTQLDIFARLLRKEAIKQEIVQRHGVAVARMLALVRLSDGSLGMRMERAHGVALDELFEQEAQRRAEPPDVRFAVTVARKLLSQLRRLHEMTEAGSPLGFIHSDIKPANVFVDARDRVDPHVTLLDFGVAIAGQLMAQDLASTVGRRTTFLLEQAGGTIGYAPPHHFTSKPTPLSDVFAALVILYELITVEWPWDAGGMRKSAVNLFRIEALMAQPPRPVRSVRETISASDAAVLDPFFSAAFSRLVKLSDQVADALGFGDHAAVDALVPTLRGLAGEFQNKLDAVAAALSGDIVVRAEPVSIATAPTIAPMRDWTESFAAQDEVAAAFAAGLDTEAPKPAPRRWVAPLALALTAAAGVALGAWWSPATRARARAMGEPSTLTAAVTDASVLAESVTDAAALDASAAAVALAPAATRPCTCFAPGRGAKVIASGGALAADVELCRTDANGDAGSSVDGDDGHQAFVGRGSIEPSVSAGFPSLRCEDADGTRLELRVETEGEGPSSATRFHCVQATTADAGAEESIDDGGASDGALTENADASATIEPDVTAPDRVRPEPPSSARAAPHSSVNARTTAAHPRATSATRRTHGTRTNSRTNSRTNTRRTGGRR